MATIIKDPSLPKNWVRKTSRRCPTASYYFNVKTGKSTWMHPAFLEQNAKAILPQTMQENEGGNEESAYNSVKKTTNENQVTSSTEASSFQEIDTSKESKPEPLANREAVKFVIKSKTFGEGAAKQEGGQSKPKKESTHLHPLLLHARKIAERCIWSKKTGDSSKKAEEKTDSKLKTKDFVSSLDTKIVRAFRRIKEEELNTNDDAKAKLEKKSDESSRTSPEKEKDEIRKEFEKRERKIVKARRRLVGLQKAQLAKDTTKKTSKDDNCKASDTIDIFESLQRDVDSRIKTLKECSQYPLELTESHGSDSKQIGLKSDSTLKRESKNVRSVMKTNDSPSTPNKIEREPVVKEKIEELDNEPSVSFEKPPAYSIGSPVSSPKESTPTSLATETRTDDSKYNSFDERSDDRRHRRRRRDKYRSGSKKADKDTSSKSTAEGRKSRHKEEPVPTKDSDEVVHMEVEEQEIISEIANFRGSISHSRHQGVSQLLTSKIDSSSTSLYVVVDTNVLIKDKDFLNSLKGRAIEGQDTVIVIPYTALQEMDGLKKNEAIGRACQSAISWCNHHFEAKDPRVQGQSYDIYLETLSKNPRASGDDLIRDCCLLMKKDGLAVCLLSNDINLRNKALMSNISSIGVRDLRIKLEETASKKCNKIEEDSQQLEVLGMPDNDVQILEEYGCVPSNRISQDEDLESPLPVKQARLSASRASHKQRTPKHPTESRLSLDNSRHLGDIIESLHATLGQILEHIMIEAYGDIWISIVIHKPPWTLQEIFFCWDKHWLAVMIEKFPRDLQNLMKKIRLTLKANIKEEEDIKILKRNVELLYNFFKKDPYKKFIAPIHSDSVSLSPDAPMNEAVTPPRMTDTHEEAGFGEEALGQNTMEINNVQEMINHVGMHITHFTALILDAYGESHDLPKLNSTTTMSQENAHSSAVNLYNVIMNMGTAIVRCVNETTAESVQNFGELLINFWAEAKEPCPNLPFTAEDIMHIVASPVGLQFLQVTLQELEKLINVLKSVLEKH
ncbi:transcriptional protein SWT1-like [Penaeus indicus]|uniref:transcriptional protein SWT1-like n=1 Tax=Penaeus indicus TaxID=29960 RepID=UPI00300D9C37